MRPLTTTCLVVITFRLAFGQVYTISTVAGNGTQGYAGDGGPATNAEVYSVPGVATGPNNDLYIADFYLIRKVSNGVITTVAGSISSCLAAFPPPCAGFAGDNGPAAGAKFNAASRIAVDFAGNLYVADSGNGRIRKVSNGMVTTVAGNGAFTYSGDNGPATAAGLSNSLGVAVDAADNLYIADAGNNRIRKVSNGVITTVAGNGTRGFSGDNGPATSAQLNSPLGIAVDLAGDLYIIDKFNQRVRRVSNGVITTIAGSGVQGFGGDGGPATTAQLGNPNGVAVDATGAVYIADWSNRRIRKVSGGVITTIAGNGIGGFGGDTGPATNAGLGYPSDVAADSAGNLYVADYGNNRVRFLTALGSSCSYSVSPTSWQVPAGGGSQSFAIQTAASCSWTISNLPSWLTVSGTSFGMGPSTVNLVAAPNSGPAVGATVSIAGASVNITEASGIPVCSYSISPGGQAFAAAGGTGTIAITTAAGCTWTATTTLSWISFTSPTSGTGSGTVTYQAALNTGADRSGSITIAGLKFTTEEASASLTGFTNVGSMAQLASAGSWTTTLTLVNVSSAAVGVRLNFFDNSGSPLGLPLTFPQSPNPGPVVVSTLDRSVNPGAELVIQTTGPTTQPAQVGWAQLLANGPIGGFAVFTQAVGSSVQDGVVPLESRDASSYVLPFDNTNGSATGVALANVSPLPTTVALAIRDDTGALLLSDNIALAAMGHTAFNLTDKYAPATAQRRGTLVFTTPGAGQISVLGLRFNSTGAFSTIPALSP